MYENESNYLFSPEMCNRVTKLTVKRIQMFQTLEKLDLTPLSPRRNGRSQPKKKGAFTQRDHSDKKTPDFWEGNKTERRFAS